MESGAPLLADFARSGDFRFRGFAAGATVEERGFKPRVKSIDKEEGL